MIVRRLIWALALFSIPAVPWAQSLPPSVRACAAETDAEQRHACYDREVARILDAEKGSPARGTAAAPRPAAAPRTPAAAPHESPLEQSSDTRSSSSQPNDRLSARIVSVDTAPDELVLHLDNGETWEQIDRTSGGLGLRAGDVVTIEKHLGSYWLSARHVSGMRVRKKTDLRRG